MVHRDDAAGAIRFLLDADHARGEVVNVVDDDPVSKWAFADWLAEQCGREHPPKRTKAQRLADDNLSDAARRRIQTSKRVSNAKLRALGYEFAYPTFRAGYRAALEEYCA
jgi:nucleoside-diphosphate-sugar epimerase